AEVVFT
nr:Chain A, Amyloid forming peptide AEVVFT [synthetic construct]4XFN_B Chain B, Amyloid forming peptide AEVVFT [synthetic construct]